MTLIADFNSSVNVPFQRMRQMLLDGALQEGVVGANDFKVVQRGAGANQSVDVGTGFAWVQIDTGTRNGMGHVTNDATANVTVTASNATNPRIDQIILRWNDSSIPTGSGNVPTLEVLTGTATAGAQAANPAAANYRAGAAALPNDCLRLADILVPATSTSVTTANIVDRRPWARGVNRYVRGSTSGPTISAAYAAAAVIPEMTITAEFTGAPVRVTFTADFAQTVAANFVGTELRLDGAAVTVTDPGDTIRSKTLAAAGASDAMAWTIAFTPAAGRHTVAVYWWVGANQGSSTGTRRQMSVRELVLQNADNA